MNCSSVNEYLSFIFVNINVNVNILFISLKNMNVFKDKLKEIKKR